MDQLITFISNHWVLCLLLLVVLFVIFVNETVSQKTRPQALSPQAAIKCMNEEAAVVIDLRDTEKFEKGHIIHSLKATEEDFSQKRFDKYKENTLILVCAEGVSSTKIAEKLKKMGFAKPCVLSGGILAWRNAELPLIKGR